jgi:isopenicillin N synthase-like dioxygenase
MRACDTSDAPALAVVRDLRQGTAMSAADLAPVPLALADRDPAAAAAALGEAFARTGFAVIADHGLDPALIARAEAAARALFALPEVEKAALVVPGGGGQRGLTPFGREAAKGAARADLKEFWHIGREGDPALPPNVWPPVTDFREATLALHAALEATGLRILRPIARHLGLPDDHFEAAVTGGNSILRLLHYPPVPAGADGLRAEAHEDINVITLLLGAEEAGLELLGPDGRWTSINVPPGALVCNIGDMLQRYSGGRLPSTTHRVVNPAPDRAGIARYSMPFFLHFRADVLIQSMPGGPRHWPPVTADAYLSERLREIRLL